MKLVIENCALARIAEAAVMALPEEGCGLLIGFRKGDAAYATRVFATRNVASGNRRLRFEVDPRALIESHRAARKAGWSVIGHFHSHPDGRPFPSATDAKMAHESDAIWVIQPIAAGAAGEPRAFRARPGGRFDPVEIAAVPEIVEEA